VILPVVIAAVLIVTFLHLCTTTRAAYKSFLKTQKDSSKSPDLNRKPEFTRYPKSDESVD